MKISEMGELIGKYLRETRRIPKEDINLSDYEIGEKVFNSHSKGELYPFLNYIMKRVNITTCDFQNQIRAGA